MPRVPKRLLAAYAAATVAGAFLHFLYELFPNLLTALIAPVNESLWEHVKILLWPYLAAAFILTRGGGRGTRTPWLLTALLLCGAMLAAGYVYHIPLGGEALAVDIGIYVVLMAAGFVLPGLLHPAADHPGLGDLSLLLVLALAGAVALFTFLPPDHILFVDLSGANTWATLPC